MRRTELRGHTSILKRLRVQAGAFNLGLLLRQKLGVRTPRGLQGHLVAAMIVVFGFFAGIRRMFWSSIWDLLEKAAARNRFAKRDSGSLSSSN